MTIINTIHFKFKFREALIPTFWKFRLQNKLYPPESWYSLRNLIHGYLSRNISGVSIGSLPCRVTYPFQQSCGSFAYSLCQLWHSFMEFWVFFNILRTVLIRTAYKIFAMSLTKYSSGVLIILSEFIRLLWNYHHWPSSIF